MIRINFVEVGKIHSGVNIWSRKMMNFLPKDEFSRKVSIDYASEHEGKFDLVYYNFYRRVKKIKTPSVALFTHIETYNSGMEQKFYNAANRVDHIIVISQLYKDILMKKGYAASKITVANLGCDLETFKPKIKLGIAAWKRESGRKGEKCLSAFLEHTTIPLEYLKFIIVGREWENWVEKHEKLVDIDYRGKVEPEQVAEMMQEIDYYLCPSKYEGQCLPLMEAYACGKPIISRLVGMVCNELEEVTIFDSHYDLDVILNRLIMDKRKSVEQYTWENYAAKHIAVFRATAKK